MPITDGIHQSDEGGGSPPNRSARVHYALYLLPLVLAPILLLLFGLFVIPTQWYTSLGGDPWLMGMGYGGTLHHADCQLVVYGDSTAMIGVDSERIRQRTGLKTCNIAENEGSIILNGTMVLDQYLSQNARPRYILFLFAPEDLDPFSPKQKHGLFEAITYRLRQPHKLASLWLILHRPEDIFTWLSAGMDSMLRHIRGRHLTVEEMSTRERHGGRLTMLDAPLTSCTEDPFEIPPNLPWLGGLRDKYRSAGTTVLVDAMPLPVCDPSLAYYKERLPTVVDNPGLTFPVSAYIYGGRHASTEGIALLSDTLSKQILDLQQSSGR
jgi:hypothetical protein